MLEVSLGDDHPLLVNALIDIAEAKMKQLRRLPDDEVCGLGPKEWVRFGGYTVICERNSAVNALRGEYDIRRRWPCRSRIQERLPV